MKSYTEKVFDTFCLIIIFFLFGITGITHFDMIYSISLILGLFLLFRYMIIIVDINKKATKLFYAGIILNYFIFCFQSRQWYSALLWITIISIIKTHNKNKIILNCIFYSVPIVTYIAIIHFQFKKDSIQNIVLNIIVLNLIMIGYFVINYYYKKYIGYKQKSNKILYQFAINELVEKNLNNKLAINNYLIQRNTRLEERETINRNIHNCVGHTITAAIMALEAAEVLADVSPTKAKGKIEVANSRMHESLNGIRQAVRASDDETSSLLLSQLFEILTRSIEKFSLDTDVKIRHNLNFDYVKCDFEIDKKHIEFLNCAMLEAFSNGV